MTKIDWDKAKRPKGGTVHIASAPERPWVPPGAQKRQAEKRGAEQRALTQRSKQHDDDLQLAQLEAMTVARIREKRERREPLSDLERLIVRKWLDEG